MKGCVYDKFEFVSLISFEFWIARLFVLMLCLKQKPWKQFFHQRFWFVSKFKLNWHKRFFFSCCILLSLNYQQLRMHVVQSTLFLWFMLSVNVSVLMSVLCMCNLAWYVVTLFIHVVMSLIDAVRDRCMLQLDLVMSLYGMVCLELPG